MISSFPKLLSDAIITSSAPGSEWKNGLAWVIIGGLSTSLFLTVFVVPMVYYCIDRVGQKWSQWFPKNSRVNSAGSKTVTVS